MNDPKLIEKIQKMLELGRRGGTEAEMETAMRMVHELLAKYNLSLADLKESSPSDENTVHDETFVPGKRGKLWQEDIWDAIASLYFCFYYRCRVGVDDPVPHRLYILIGRPSNVAIAKNMITYVIETGEKLAASYPSAAARNSFKQGFASRIEQRADAEIARAKANELKDDAGNALILAPIYEQAEREAQELLAARGIKLSYFRSNYSVGDEDAFHSGREAADRISLKANGVERSTAPVGLLGR